MALEDTDKPLEQSSESTATKPSDSTLKDIDAGKEHNNKEQIAQTEYFKKGGKTFITEDFGKPGFYDSSVQVAKGDLSAEQIASYSRTSDLPLGEVSGDPEAQGQMGRVGDRSKDSGKGSSGAAEVTRDAQGHLTEYKLPDGQKYEIKYDDAGNPKTVTITPENGQPITFEKNKNGDWRNPNDSKQGLDYVSVDKDGNLTIRSLEQDTKLGTDGSFEEKNWRNGKLESKIDSDGTTHRFDNDKGTEVVTKPGSHVSEVKSQNGGATQGYEIRDDQGHVTQVELNDKGGGTVTRGDKTTTYDKIEKDANGDLKFTSKDKSTVQVKEDGTQITRDAGGKVTEITNSDSETTKFKRDASGKVTEVTVSDGQGKIIEKKNGAIDVDNASGTYTVERDKDHKVERKADGTERLLDKDGKPVESESDKLLAKFKNYTPEQQKQLKQDLADIDKLPEEQRKKVYESLDRIARNDEHPEQKVRLTGQQSRELVASLAHQIAHPESIQQGDKMTCVLANSEQMMAKNHPELYADMVSKLATDGKYTTPGGKTIEAQKNPDGTLASKTDAYSQRTAASELFQNGAAQLGMKDGDTYKSYPPGSPELEPRPAGVSPSNDTGERIVHKDGTTSKFNGFDSKEQADILNQLAPSDKYKATDPIQTPADLEKALKENGGTPLGVGIHLGPESGFTGMPGSSGAAGSGYHAVNITRIETGPDGKKYVYYENPAGGSDHSYPNGKGVPIDDFVKAMQGGNTKMRAVVKEKKA